MTQPTTVILPAKREATNLEALLPRRRQACPEAEILVVDDGSDDDPARICAQQGVWRLAHPYSMGNGAAIKTGARHASSGILVFMDAGGQHELRRRREH